MMRVVFVLALAAAGAAASDPALEIESAAVTAGDLAGAAAGFETLDPETVFSRAPAPGVTRRVSRYELVRWAESAGLASSAEDLPDSLLIRRKMRLLGEREAQTAIREAAARAQQVPIEDVEAELHGWAPRPVPATATNLETTALPRTLNEPGPVRLRWRDPGGRSGVETVRATLRVRGVWLETRAELAAGVRLTAADLRQAEGFLPSAPGTLLRPERLAEEPQLTRGLRAQTPVRDSDVLFAPLVERGALVELRLDTGGVRLRAPARAEQPGGRGELIACRNLETGRRVLGRVIDGRSVALETGAASEASRDR